MIIKIREAFMRVARLIFDKQLETDVYNGAFLGSNVAYFKFHQFGQVRKSYKIFLFLVFKFPYSFENWLWEQWTSFFKLRFRDIKEMTDKMKELGEIQHDIGIGGRIL